jgi:molecular chaperone GrpE
VTTDRPAEEDTSVPPTPPEQEGAETGAPAAPVTDASPGVLADEPPLPEEEDASAAVARERDDYLDALRRLQAEFENYKKRMLRQQTETLERAGQDLVEKLLPVLDAIDLARSHGAGADLEQVASALLDVLAKEGLQRIDPVGLPFDPTEQDAVQHEPGEEGEEPHVAGLLRAGWRWKGRVLRPAMVTVKG